MLSAVNLKVGLGLSLAGICLAWIVVIGAACESAPQPFTVSGPGFAGNQPPTLTITEPTTDVTVGQGDVFLVQWTDTDPDDDATISFQLVSVASGAAINWVDGLEENDTTGPDSVRPPTTFLTPDRYNLRGIIDDGVNEPVETFARATGAVAGPRVVITVVGPGEAPQTIPPVVAVAQPSFDRSVAQDDVLTIVVQPTAQAPIPNDPNAVPFDPDSEVTLFLVLDVDLDPNNDDPRNPDPSQIILLEDPPRTLPPNTTGAITVDIVIDVGRIPTRPNGEPYFVRATVDDGTNPRVHQYAAGEISVVRLAAGTIDLFDIGRTLSGARFQGFNPTANVGSTATSVSDFDADGVDDFVLVAQFGNPQNVGPVGEAYLVYGQSGVRFGGTIPVNSIGATFAGVAFQAPPVRVDLIPGGRGTDGINDVSFVRDLTGDGRPEILFGLQHVEGALNTTDYDPADTQLPDGVLDCYRDFLVNDASNTDNMFEDDITFYAGGLGLIFNSQNRDNSDFFSINTIRLDSTFISLEHVGQRGVLLGVGGLNPTGALGPRADNSFANNVGSDPEEEDRIAGARLIAGGYEFLNSLGKPEQGPREGLWGRTIRSLPDMNIDGLDEIIVSAPRTELYLEELAQAGGGTQLTSTFFAGSIAVFPGQNYNVLLDRDQRSSRGTSQQPSLDQHRDRPFGGCGVTVAGQPPEPGDPRTYFRPVDAFNIFAEATDDFLGNGQSAGDFNQDGRGDILCGARLNDLSPAMPDSGATYVIYGRSPFGAIQLSFADDPVLRAPMLRIRGESVNDQIGWRQATGLDVNGDRLDDVFFSSPRTDFPGPDGIARTTCGGTFKGAAVSTTTMGDFLGCQTDVVAEGDLFTDDPCKAFDFDNDDEITFDDQCVFQCLTADPDRPAECIVGTDPNDCCANLVDNGFVGIIFGGELIDGDRVLSQLATSELPGTIFFGAHALDRAGLDVSSAGDFNQDGFGDILIVAPGEIRTDSAGRDRRGVVYLVFGGTHLTNRQWNLADVGSLALPGMVFISPFVTGRPNEAAPLSVAFIGDVNNDGFGDIIIGNPKADFIDSSFPQGPDATDASIGRRSNAGDAYLIYGNNFDTNRLAP